MTYLKILEVLKKKDSYPELVRRSIRVSKGWKILFTDALELVLNVENRQTIEYKFRRHSI